MFVPRNKTLGPHGFMCEFNQMFIEDTTATLSVNQTLKKSKTSLAVTLTSLYHTGKMDLSTIHLLAIVMLP